MKKTFSIRGAYKEAYAIIKPKLWTVIGQFLLIYGGLSILFGILLGRGAALGSIITSFILIKWALAYANKGSFTADDIFEGVTFKSFVYYLMTVALIMLSVIGGLFLLIIPGIIFAIRLDFAKYIAIENNIKPMDALRESKRITKGVRWKLFWFYMTAIFMVLLGVVCLVVGIFFTAPLVAIASVVIYKQLKAQSSNAPEEVVEVVIETIEVSQA